MPSDNDPPSQRVLRMRLDAEPHASVGTDDTACGPSRLGQAEHTHHTGNLFTVGWSPSCILRRLVDLLVVDALPRCSKRSVLDERLDLVGEVLVVAPVHVCRDWARVDSIDSANSRDHVLVMLSSAALVPP
jgi:hypothetical protein